MKNLKILMILIFIFSVNSVFSKFFSKKNYSLNDKYETIEDAFIRLGLDQFKETDPKMMRELLKETHLDTFKTSLTSFQEHLDSMKSRSHNLRPMLNSIMDGLVKKDAMFEMIQKGIKKNWFKKSDYIKKTVHMLYLFETLTLAAGNNVEILKELQDHFFIERKKYGIDSKKILNTFIKVGKKYGKFFEPAKLLSVDPAITWNIYERQNNGVPLPLEELDRLYKNKVINIVEKKIMTPSKGAKYNPGVQTNILEASVTEYDYGYKDNAMAGYSLIYGLSLHESEFYFEQGNITPNTYWYNEIIEMIGSEDNHYHINKLTKTWVDLYTSWNATFILSEFDDLHLILPKLFIPSQINCKPEHYMYNRVITLWCAVNFTLFRALDNVTPVKKPDNISEVIKGWGKINKKHALNYVDNDLGISPKSFEKKFKKVFLRRHIELIRKISSFLIH